MSLLRLRLIMVLLVRLLWLWLLLWLWPICGLTTLIASTWTRASTRIKTGISIASKDTRARSRAGSTGTRASAGHKGHVVARFGAGLG